MDATGDGWPDVLITAPYFGSGASSGRVYVYASAPVLSAPPLVAGGSATATVEHFDWVPRAGSPRFGSCPASSTRGHATLQPMTSRTQVWWWRWPEGDSGPAGRR